MLQRLSASCQKEIALSFIALFFISGLYDVKAGIYTGMNPGNYYIGNAGPVYSYRSNTISTDNNALGNLNEMPGVLKDEKNKRKNNAALKINTGLTTASLSGKRIFDEPFIGGPSQPEMNAFKSIGSDNMVSPFTGDFSYNIPLLDVGGYPVNMFYNSGITMDQESSWVGLGWNINPGTITRNMRGLPDDFDGTDIVTKRQSFKPDKTWGVSTGADVNVVGIPMVGLGFGVSMGASFNNKLGVSAEAGVHSSISIGAKAGDYKTANLSFSIALNADSRAGASVTPTVGYSIQNQEGISGGLTGSRGVGYTYSSRQGRISMHLDANTKIGPFSSNLNSTLSLAYPSIMPSISKKFTKQSFNISTGFGLEYFWVNPHFRLGGYFTKTFIALEDKETRHPAYGMLNYQKANNDPDALLDFNRANDGIYTPASPAIAMPVYTYDIFNISGEGTGGSFRAYRSDIGHMHDASVTTKEENGSIGIDLGFGNIFHGGTNLSYVNSPTEVGDWKVNNATGKAFTFDSSNKTYQAAYFKNPGEKAIPDAVYQNAVANEDMVRFKLGNPSSATPLLLPTWIRYDANRNKLGEKLVTENTRKLSRDKRTQVISFLTAEESERIGMNTKIYAIKNQGAYENKVLFNTNCNKDGVDSLYRNHQTAHDPSWPPVLGNENNPFRKKNHISEIDVLGSDGRKYVYGLPVYNKRQVDVTFSINKSQQQGESKVIYDDEDNTVENKKGRDCIMDQQEMPAYTHSFLLTELLSPNYVDVTGNGLTEDDMGDGIKFNYSKAEDYKWRTPVGNKTATYSEGLKTDIKDDKAHYIYGEREAWYLYTIESKNMVARFYVKNDRKDGRAVLNEAGEVDPGKGMQRLDKISLFSKGELTKYGDAAKPVKTIRFFQSYKLCRNAPGTGDLGSNSINNFGKLTLDSIWITYNGNQRKPKSRYVFYYPADKNPDYNFDSNDRWGNYKPSTDNPSGLPNADYPYSVQDKTKADKNAAAWTMNKVLLPSGGVINIDYESDTYAYVQDKKAAAMCKVLGFGRGTTLPGAGDINKIYTNDGENDYVYIQLPYQITTGGKAEFKARYLADVKQLYLKLAVEMPMGAGLAGIAGSENIGIYADILDYGLVSPGIAWIKVDNLNNDHTPIVQGALQFLRQQLPGKAYKGYDVSEEGGAQAIVTALGGMIASVGAMFEGEFNQLIADKKCQDIIPDKSFAKLSVPDGIKYGGGLRVKRIVINDNWAKMANQLKATYGQEYHYNTTELINGKEEIISSGVAAWEPIVGGDENPHRSIMRYLDRNKGGPYDYGAIEMPLGEMFYPGAMVGYSRVEVLSIHRDTVKNLPTRQVTEFYTNKDFPYRSAATDLTGDANSKYEPRKIMQLLKIDLKKFVTQSQGFLVETNDMNGKEKSIATYSALDPINPVSVTRNFYNTKQATDKTLSFNHNFPTLNKADGVITSSLIGRDIELMTDFRQHTTETITHNINMSIDVTMIGPYVVPIPMMLMPVTREGTMYRAASVLKIVTHYGMLDSVVVIDKGSMVSTKNLVYDAETGNPLLTRTQNEHNKPVYNFSYPAHWAYSGMGPAYKNIDAVYTGLNFEHGILTNAATKASGFLENVVESGDEIYVLAKNNSNIPLSLPCDINEPSNTPWTTLTKNEAFKIWAVNTTKAEAANPQFLFMDSIGNPYNAMGADIRIIRSGHRNMLDQSVGNITSLNNPIQNNQLVFTETTNIIQTAAATFKDHWRVDNSFYLFDSTVTQTRWAPIKTAIIPTSKSYSVAMYRGPCSNCGYFPLHFTDSKFLLARNQSFGISNSNSKKKQKSWNLFSFNIPDLNVNSTIVSAKLTLYSHKPSTSTHMFSYNSSNGVFNDYAHGNNDPHAYAQTGANDFKVTRMIGQWPADNSSDWQNYHYNGYEIDGVENQVVPFGTQPFNPSDKNYEWTTSFDNRVEFTNVFKGMLRDKFDATKNYPLAIKISMLDANDYAHDARVCFSGYEVGKPRPPSIQVKYYNCSEAYPYGYTPSPQEEVAACMNTVFRQVSCRSKFTQRKSINPYVEGIFGNWRIDSTYAYYGDRKEDNPNNPVDTRVGGVITGYKTFWNFAAANTNLSITRNQQAADVWVWNSAITQYNRKGYEIENTDPLGRFNAGLYGYNQQLPTAVANNARIREIMFDGFEDYDYETSSNCTSCKPRRFFNYNAAIISKTDASQKHTGLNSLHLNAGETVKLQAPVTGLTEANRDYSFRLMDTANTVTGSVLDTTANGTGVEAKYYNHPDYSTPLEPGVNSSAVLLTQQNRPLKLEHPGSPVNRDYFSVKWSGKLQFPKTGSYKFTGYADNCFRLKINGQQLTSQTVWTNGSVINTETTQPQTFTLGQVVDIEVCYYDWWGGESFNLQWEATNGTTTIIPRSDIPTTALYAPAANTFNPIINSTIYCTRLDSSNIRGNGLTDTFSLIQSKKMLLSAWVKVGTANCCFPATYAPVNNVATNSIAISYAGSSQAALFYPAGNIIEGWQRYESVFEVPATASSIDVSLRNNTSNQTGSNPQLVFFDDIRIQPFNANMKSFVYHASNLRLMAELDENNYASFYEYDDDGTLTRVKKETAKGIKTITETRSALQKKIVTEN